MQLLRRRKTRLLPRCALTRISRRVFTLHEHVGCLSRSWERQLFDQEGLASSLKIFRELRHERLLEPG
jgi:hypothetical protein